MEKGTLQVSPAPTDFDAAFNAGRSYELKPVIIEGIPHVLLPPGCSLSSLEALLPAPKRIMAHPAFHDIEGFAAYVDEFKSAGSRVFVDETALSFFTIFDHHAKDQPAWGDHCASMKLEESPEWVRFKAFNDKKLSPIEFAEMIEDNLEYISAANMTSADLLTMAQSFKVDFKGNELQVQDTLQRGLRSLVVKDEGVARGAKADGTELEFPEMLTLKLRIFKYQAAYELKVYLRYRASKERVLFFIKITDPEGIREKAFAAVIDDVKTATKLPTVKGKYSGPKHK
jgi:uncharacterized protein YfdQ (DUF2303 family)